MSIWEMLHPDDLERTRAGFALTQIGQPAIQFPNRYRCKDGSYRWISWVGVPEDGMVYCTGRDITEEKAQGTELARRTAERDQLWTLSEDMLARADYEGRMSAVSPAWTRVLGYTKSELLTRPYAEIIHPEDVQATVSGLARMGETGKPTRFQNRILTANGEWKPIEWTVAPEPDGVNFIAIGRDMTAEKEAAVELERAQDALRQSQKMEAMGQLTGGVAHDFNNLLTPIVGALDVLQRRGIGGPREQRLIDGAIQSAERAKTLVQRLLAFARRQPLQPSAVDVGKLVTGMADLVASTSGPQIRVVVETADDLPAAKADQNQLEMALLNLSVNARDAMPDGGTLRITADADLIGSGHRSKLRAGRYIRLSVSDTGLGMDETTLRRAIEPFFSTKGVGKGTGLGLSMVHGLVSQLGGALSIKSKPGLGTNVEMWLPTSAEPAEATEAVVESLPATSTRGTALLVDDEDLVRMSTADMLGELGYNVVEAKSAEDALRLLREGLRPDLLVTDHLMPGMNGTELATSIPGRSPGQANPDCLGLCGGRRCCPGPTAAHQAVPQYGLRKQSRRGIGPVRVQPVWKRVHLLS